MEKLSVDILKMGKVEKLHLLLCILKCDPNSLTVRSSLQIALIYAPNYLFHLPFESHTAEWLSGQPYCEFA